jgi:uncharacterized membrane protein YeaQ/YmgE (transglycosylase-associated protein family)
VRPMDFNATCQALGIGIGIGIIAGATGLEGSARGGMTLLAAIIGLVAGIITASAGDAGVLTDAIAGLIGAAVGCIVLSDVVAGARRRRGSGVGALGFIVTLAGIVVAAVSIAIPALALVSFLALIWIGIARRRRAQRKYEGLRVLR